MTRTIVAVALVLAVADRAWGQAISGPAATEPTAPFEMSTPSGTAARVPSWFAGEGSVPVPARVEMSPLATIAESLLGDVYAEGRWRPLTLGSFFSEGWLEPWAGAPAGRDGLAPRHGWLGAFDGLFYRLWLADFGYVNNLNAPYRGNRYLGDYEIFLPFSRRFEVFLDVPFLVANGTSDPRRGYTSEFGDLTIVPRFLLAEDEATTQVLALAVRTPTGSKATGNDVMAVTTRYEFWTNPGGPWVVRGAAGVFVPLNQGQTPSHTALNGGLAAGRYFTPHDVPFGDLAIYVACNFAVPLDGSASTGTVVSLGPGTRFHLGRDYFLLNYWEFPVTGPHPDTYSVQLALLKVF